MEKGSRVGVYATKFDPPGGHAWSSQTFGENFISAVCWGTVEGIKNSFIRVKWDIDGSVTQINSELVDFTENGKINLFLLSFIIIIYFYISRFTYDRPKNDCSSG